MVIIPNGFKSALKKLNIFKVIKEGFKSIKILYLKKKLMINYIKECDSDLIISTRVEITELLNKYYKGNGILISQEHAHHNNNQKYIDRVLKSLTNIDYFMPVSRKLTKFYEKKVEGKTKVLYSPLCVDYIPEKESKKENKNIVSIGRLSHEKGFLDLIDVFSLINKEDNECILHIIGDGEEKTKIEEKINELNLKDNVILYGYKDKEFIREKLNDMSLYYANSKDGLNWNKMITILEPTIHSQYWDNKGIYRSSILYSDSKYFIFYGGTKKDYHHGVGLVYGKDITKLHKVNTNFRNKKEVEKLREKINNE